MFVPDKKKLNKMIANVLEDHNYKMVSSVTLQATHLVVFAAISLVPLIKDVSNDLIATGINNMMGNKGAVTVKFRVGWTKFQVVNAHFNSGQHEVDRRNEDFKRAYNHLCADKHKVQANPKKVNTEVKPDSLVDDVLIFMGDLNYRVEGTYKTVKEMMKKDAYDVLHHNDQLTA